MLVRGHRGPWSWAGEVILILLPGGRLPPIWDRTGRRGPGRVHLHLQVILERLQEGRGTTVEAGPLLTSHQLPLRTSACEVLPTRLPAIMAACALTHFLSCLYSSRKLALASGSIRVCIPWANDEAQRPQSAANVVQYRIAE